jgi:hypothetical protein
MIEPQPSWSDQETGGLVQVIVSRFSTYWTKDERSAALDPELTKDWPAERRLRDIEQGALHSGASTA